MSDFKSGVCLGIAIGCVFSGLLLNVGIETKEFIKDEVREQLSEELNAK